MSLNADNLAGVLQVKMVQAYHIGTWPLLNVAGDRLLGAVPLVSGTWFDFPFVQNAASMSIKPVMVGDDEFQDVAVVMDVDMQEQPSIPTEDYRKRVVLDVLDKNGNRYLVGTKDEPLIVRGERLTGDRPGAFVGLRITISGRLRLRPPFYGA